MTRVSSHGPLSGESADKFLVRLKKQARHCNFGEALDDNLRDPLIEKSSGRRNC